MIEAFRIVRDRVPGPRSMLAGSMATDDPEGFKVWDDTDHTTPATATSTSFRTCTRWVRCRSTRSNASRRSCCTKSFREGFGLTVAEGLWKGRPVISGRAGGIKLQIRDGFDGYLVDSVEESAQRTIDLLADPVGADALGAQGREHVRENFLSTGETRRLADPVRDTAQVMLVTHRGPYRFSERDDGSFAPNAARVAW